MILFTLGVAGCRDEQPLLADAPGARKIGFVAESSPPAGTDVGLYWHHADTLWAYDKRPEVGIGVHFIEPAVGGVTAPFQYAQIQQLGMRLVRITLLWPDVDPNATGYAANYIQKDLQDLDYAVIKARQAGLEPVVVVHTNKNPEPANFTFSEDPNNPINLAFARFMRDMAARYDEPHNTVRYWQLFNEMDAGGWTRLFGGAAGKTKQAQGWHYAKMLQHAYPAIKGANPNAWVISGGLTGLGNGEPNAPRNYEFLHGMYNGNAKHYFDFLAVHSYGGKGPAPVDSAGVQLIRHLDWNGDIGRPIWVTEFGTSASLYATESPFPTLTPAAFDSTHKSFWQGALTTHQTSGHFVKMLGYQLFSVDGGGPAGADSLNYTFGLVRGDQVTPRPTFNALAAGNFNAFVLGTPTRTVDVDVTFDGRYPVGYTYTRIGTHILRIHNVTVNNLHPTKIAFSGASGAREARVCYQVYSTGYGWSGAYCDGQAAGPVWESRSSEAIRVWLQWPPAGMGVCYRVNRAGQGWSPEVCNGGYAGGVGEGHQIEGMEVRLTGATAGSRVCYQVHNGTLGWWQGTRCDGALGGSTGLNRMIVAMWVKLTT